ncbi:GntR family transcriptional regulator [Streptococcus ruminantium]|uniref:GntR family transcriptional regulator n=1 Tax=Streptococcus ruminantium TaxID=1917441 RepID=UPI0012DE747D|nr:GntR family transcriptional regulator [Streptococcus ruminantium]MDQ8820878.1 GntR family transcriptional regulator [Streptococcus ruminantium]MDQ8837759.1 GntR family transcriptional regulator [Streptococcus ruminantium]BDD42041.1 GntR family transcriptional regulator [Streptococcus ruminantium]
MVRQVVEKPLYLQLVDELEVAIRDRMAPNDKLFSERELTQVYGVSRITVRLALQELEKRGLVYKKHGKGTYVSEISKAAVDLSQAYSFTEQMKEIGKVPRTSILSFELVKATNYIAQHLQVSFGEEVLEIERLRLADEVPMMLERTYVPVSLFSGLTAQRMKEKPLYEIFSEDYGQTIRLAEEEFYASIALDNEAKILGIPSNAPVLHLVRKTYNDKNRMIEFTFSIARADQFRYKIIHQRGY